MTVESEKFDKKWGAATWTWTLQFCHFDTSETLEVSDLSKKNCPN